MPLSPIPSAGKGRILIVDDDPDFREFVRIVLEAHGYEVLEAANATACLALMRASRPHLTLLDAMMSYELTGIDIIRAVRNDPELAALPLVLVSAVLNERADRFLPAGERRLLDRLLTKPISPAELLRTVTATLAGSAES